MNKNNDWQILMDSLKSQHKKIAELIGDQKVAYIDMPLYFNVGDLLIYKGTERFIEEYNVNVVYRAGYKYNSKKVESADVILLQGGGNFGDLYGKHQSLREDIVKKFPGKKIICLPQSIHYENSDNLSKSLEIFRKHSDFHFCVRDHESIKLAKKFTDKVYLMPDMAHSLHPLISKIGNRSPGGC